MGKVKVERSRCGSGGCITCPFSCGPDAEQGYNWACLPSQSDILRMKKESGHNWECHSADGVKCGGLATYIKENELPLSVKDGGIIKHDTWYYQGEEAAIQEADKSVEGVK